MRHALLFGSLALGVAVSGCSEGQKAPPAAAGAPPAVTVVKVTTEEIRPFSTFTGRIEATFKVDLRARIDGFLEKRLFTEGADVKDGDLLFAIEKGLYQAAVDQAKGALEQAQAALKLADLEVDRQTQLFQRNVSAQATLDQAVAKQGEARGGVLVQKAALEKAELQLSYTDIRAPISGRIGRASVSIGNYVTANSNALATIVSQDPIYVNFPISQRELLMVRKEQSNRVNPQGYVAYIQLADGTRYEETGTLDFVDVTVSQATDTVLIRASFPNPDRVLVDGALVTVVVEHGKAERALQVPQQAMQIDQSGSYVLVVDKDNKVQVRRIETGPTTGTRVTVIKGLSADERVITEGLQRVRPGQVVQATEAKPVG